VRPACGNSPYSRHNGRYFLLPALAVERGLRQTVCGSLSKEDTLKEQDKLTVAVWDAIEETTGAAVDRSRIEIDLGSLGIKTPAHRKRLRTILGDRICFPSEGVTRKLRIEPGTLVKSLLGDIAGKGGTRPR
jgi:hypothetical protein